MKLLGKEMEYKSLNDFELVSLIRESNEEATNTLFLKYRPMIISTAKKMYQNNQNIGLDLNDLIQEGMFGFSMALNTYQDNKNTIFFTYAKACVDRRILSAIKQYSRLKYKLLNESLPISTNSDQLCDLECFITDKNSNPENIIMYNDELNNSINKLKEKLTDIEAQVFELKISGFGYKEIAQILDVPPKKIDNALQRIKNKISNLKTNN